MMRMPRSPVLFLVALSLATGFHAANAQDKTWPREMQTEKGVLTIYQPQPEKFQSNILQGRAAISLIPKGKSSPIFGAFWFTARVDTDRDAGTAMIRDIVVTESRWPESTEEKQKEFSAFLTQLMPKTGVPISLETLKQSLATAEVEKKGLEDLKHDPPKIVVSNEPAVLLLYDGKPKTLPLGETPYEFAANASLAVIKDKKSGTFYLCGGKIWYSADNPNGPWTSIAAPPAEVAKMVPADTSSTPAPSPPPKIVVATEPTELIVIDGAANWQALTDTQLLYVTNTENKIVRDIASGKVYVLLSGRWFLATKEMEGPWKVTRPDELPADFKKISPASALAGVRVSVAGTPEAEEAMLDAQVPQTAAIERGKATLEVKYDGDPKFKPIEGTKIDYATNTGTQVLRIDGKFYACDKAVWFVSNKPTGPWTVAESVPAAEIDKIPPSSPVYNVKYVEVYESTPEVIYVGYTSGYVYSYPWYGVPVYGTGWYYPPYWGRVYYPAPYTYGYAVAYTPY